MDRNGTDLTEAKEIKKRWQEYTEELYKKDLHDPDNQDGVTDLEPDILECVIKTESRLQWGQGRLAVSPEILAEATYNNSIHILMKILVRVQASYFSPYIGNESM